MRSFLEGRIDAASAALRAPAPPEALDAASLDIGCPLPEPLRALYAFADGQEAGARGLFGGRCAWDPREEAVTWRPHEVEIAPARFLPIGEAVAKWRALVADTELDVFTPDLIPFAEGPMMTLFCMESGTGAVWLLWTGGPDWTLPREWQTLRRRVAPDLDSFLRDVLATGGSP